MYQKQAGGEQEQKLAQRLGCERGRGLGLDTWLVLRRLRLSRVGRR